MRGSTALVGLAVLGSIPLGSRLLQPRVPAAREQTAARAEPDLASAAHPLKPVLELARQTYEHARRNVRGFTCQLIKRERIGGELQQERTINMIVREGSGGDEPYATRMDFLSPSDVAGRRLLYVEGEHDNRMLARKGGQRLTFIVLRLDPHGFKANGETLASITHLSFERSLEKIVQALERQIEADPAALNTLVEWDDAANLAGCNCRRVRVVHPRRDEPLVFYRAEVFLDDQHGLPIRITLHDWPEDGNQPPLIAEYTYRDLAVCDTLPPATFDPAWLRQE